MNVPKLRFGEFAGDWEISTFDDIALKQSRKYNPETEKKDLTCIELEHIEQGTGSLLGSVSAKEQKSIKNRFSQGNVLFGKLRPYLRKYAQPNFDGVCSSEIWVFSGKTVNNDFLYRLIQTDYFMSAVSSTSGSKMPRAEWDLLKNLNFGYPKNTNEQQKIADFLSAVDDKITALTAQKTALTQYKQGMMQRIFSQTLRFKDDNGADYPDWKNVMFGDIASFSKGKGISKADISDGGKLECIRYGELYTYYKETIKNVVSRTNQLPSALVLSEANDVIIPASGETQLDIATASCVLKAGVALGGDLNIIKSDVDGVFLAYYLNNAKKQSIANLAQGISVVHLYASQLKTMDLDIPEKQEQQKIARFLTECDDKINAVDAQIQSAQQWKQGLLQQMFV